MFLTLQEFEERSRRLVGLKVSRPWQALGSGILFELGRLSQPNPELAPSGEACISVEWDWRVEAGCRVLYGSSDGRHKSGAGIRSLRDTTIQSITVTGMVPELVVEFSNGHCLRTMVMTRGDPEWSIMTLDGEWIQARCGKLLQGSEPEGHSALEMEQLSLAMRAMHRWGIPEAHPVAGQCEDCVSFVRLDGSGDLLSYGCCVAQKGPFDGRTVHESSGCPAFRPREETS